MVIELLQELLKKKTLKDIHVNIKDLKINLKYLKVWLKNEKFKFNTHISCLSCFLIMVIFINNY